jgi:hypothetical protein
MNLNDRILEIRQQQRIKKAPNNEPAAVWTGKDLLQGEVTDTLTLIFKTCGCWWGIKGGCTMCGFVYDRASTPPSAEDLLQQYEKALERSSGLQEFIVKIFTSGSFLDEKEIDAQVRETLLNKMEADERIKKVIVETRPEFVTEDTLASCTEVLKNTGFEIAIGLETSSDLIRKRSINKGFTYAGFSRAAQLAHEKGVTVKAYLLLKPPFLSEIEGMNDIIDTINDIAGLVDTVSINLCNVQRGTFVERLWERNQYRPPWLWSIVGILMESKRRHPDLVITSDPVGAGSKRGPHNCRECSHMVADMIREYSLTQDIAILEDLNCDCKEEWEKVLELDGLTFGCPIKS